MAAMSRGLSWIFCISSGVSHEPSDSLACRGAIDSFMAACTSGSRKGSAAVFDLPTSVGASSERLLASPASLGAPLLLPGVVLDLDLDLALDLELELELELGVKFDLDLDFDDKKPF
eukprot:scaffold7375_cov268-Pinguiococcus_pyrenoidosus.AAC.53